MLFIEHYFEHDDLLLLLPCVSTLTNALFGEKKVFTRVVINIFLKRGCFSNKFSKFFSPSGFDKLGSCIVGGKTGMRC